MKREWKPKRQCGTKEWTCPRLIHETWDDIWTCKELKRELCRFLNRESEYPARHKDCPLLNVTITITEKPKAAPSD